MKINQISQLLGVKVTNQNKKEAIEISNTILFKIIKLFKTETFGVVTLYGINPKKTKQAQPFFELAENYLRLKKLNFIKISAKWNIKFKEMMNFNEVGYFLFNPTFSEMLEISRQFDQSLFVYSKYGDTQVFHTNGSKFNLEKDNYDFGSIVESASILNFVDFKLFIDSIIDFDFQFLKMDEIKIDDRIVIFSKNKFTMDTHLEIIDVYDIRQNGIISFERSKSTPAISPKVFHFDEIVWAFKLNPAKVNFDARIYKNAV